MLIFRGLHIGLRKEKIQGTYFKICRTYFKISQTYFCPRRGVCRRKQTNMHTKKRIIKIPA